MSNKEKKTRLSRRDLLFRPFKGLREQDHVQSLSGLDSLHFQADQALKKGRFAEAATQYEQCLDKNPEDIEARKRLGLSLYRQGRLDESREHFERALSQREGDSFSLLYLGLVHASLGNLKRAVIVWNEYFNLDQPLILREINLQKALLESDSPPSAEEVVASIEEAIEEQKKG